MKKCIFASGKMGYYSKKIHLVTQKITKENSAVYPPLFVVSWLLIPILLCRL